MLELAPVVPIALVLFLALLYLRREAGARDWAVAWLLLWVGPCWVCCPPRVGSCGAPATRSRPCRSYFLLRAALAFAGSRVPAWVAPAVLVMAAVRAGLWWSGRHEATWLLNWLCEGPLAIWAAVAVVRIPDRAEVSINERILP